MNLSLFDYDLPRELIAQYPTRRRDQSRLMVLNRASGEIGHRKFRHIIEYLRRGDALVVNNTRVFKARLIGKRVTGGQVEVFLVRRLEDTSVESWEALAQPSRRLKAGERIWFDEKHSLELVANLGDGRWEVCFDSVTACKKIIAGFGHVPLPQYIARSDQHADLRRYQTVFAKTEQTGAVAAPTAGFHLTRGLLTKLRTAGVKVCEITLHVGPGTFKPITVESIEDHTIDPEFVEISEEVTDTLNEVRSSGGRVFAVGTTSVRTLESARVTNGGIAPFRGMVNTYIRPGHDFQMVDHLITNFHLPKSSLLVLVSAFAGREQILRAYAEAIRERYRFYSYGDAMLLL